MCIKRAAIKFRVEHATRVLRPATRRTEREDAAFPASARQAICDTHLFSDRRVAAQSTRVACSTQEIP